MFLRLMSNMPMCVTPSNSGWLLSYVKETGKLMCFIITHNHNTSFSNESLILVGFLPCNNGCSCEFHPFGSSNLLVLNRDDHRVGMQLHLWMPAPHQLACYTINEDETDCCCICFVAWEVSAVGNAAQLDDTIVCRTSSIWTTITTP